MAVQCERGRLKERGHGVMKEVNGKARKRGALDEGKGEITQ